MTFDLHEISIESQATIRTLLSTGISCSLVDKAMEEAIVCLGLQLSKVILSMLYSKSDPCSDRSEPQLTGGNVDQNPFFVPYCAGPMCAN